MTDYIKLFKDDFFNGIIVLSKRIWLKVAYAYGIYYAVAMVVGLIFAAIAVLGVLDADILSDFMGNPSPEDSLLLIQRISDIILTPEFIISFIIVIFLMLILASWNYYIAFITANSEIKQKQTSFGNLLKASISIEVFKLVGLTLVLNIIIGLMFLAAAFSTSFSGILALFLFLAAFVTSMRFILVLPAFVIGNYDFNSAFAFSFYHINWSRAIKFFGVILLAMFAIVGISLIIGLISGIFSLIPIVGPLVQIAINVLLGAIMMTITVSALTGLFYRYANINNSNADLHVAIEE